MPVLGIPKSGSRRCVPREGRVEEGKVWREFRDCLGSGNRERIKCTRPHPELWGARVPFHPWRRRKLVEADLSVYRGQSLSFVTLVTCLRYPAISARLSTLQAIELSYSELLHCVLSQHGGDGWVCNLRQNCSERSGYRTRVAMILLSLVHTACHRHCWLHRLRL